MKKSDPTMANDRLAELLSATEEAFLRWFAGERISEDSDYLGRARRITRKFARFCRGEVAAHPWDLRQKYLASRQMLRAQRPYSAGYLRVHKKQLTAFLRWYLGEAAAGKVAFGQLPAELVDTYWCVGKGVSDSRKKIVEDHLPRLGEFLQKFSAKGQSMDVDRLLADYFEQRRLAVRGGGYSRMMTVLAEQVTRKHLGWLERQGNLPAGTSRGAGDVPAVRVGRGPEELLSFFAAKVDGDLPEGLRRPLLEYIEHLVHDRELVESSLYGRLRANLALCRRLAEDGVDSFGRLRVRHLDEVVSSLVSAAAQDMLRRRWQVKKLHSELRCFLRYLQEKGLVKRDLASALISPPCYRDSTPPRVLSENQVRRLLESVDPGCAKGRRSYAVLMLMTTYGLRPVDVSGLKLDDLHWQDETISIVQSKTGVALTLPLVAEVARALYEYLRQDRDLQVIHRQVFLSLYWPHKPLSPPAVADLVKEALRQAGLDRVSARHLRGSVATHLLRQGEPLGAIQDILGHRTAETTQRYAVVDPSLLRRVLDEEER